MKLLLASALVLIISTASAGGLKSRHICTTYHGDGTSNLYAQTSANIVNGLVAYWPFGANGLAINAKDVSGNGNAGTLTSTSKAIGGAGGAANFNGTTSVITVANASSINFGVGSFTIAFWLNATTWGGSTSPAVVSKELDSSTNYGVIIYNDGSTNCAGACNPYLNMRMHGATTLYSYLYSHSTVQTGQWHFWSAIYNATAQKFSWYKDGVLDSTYTSINAGSLTSTLPLLIGESQNWSGFLNGNLSDLRIYNRALASDEISHLYAPGCY